MIRHLICGNHLDWLWTVDTVDWGKKWLVDFNSGKSQLLSFDWPNNSDSIYVKMDGFVLEEKSTFKMLGLTFSSKLYWGFYFISMSPRKLELYSFYDVSFS